jgi:outer membrane receptor protein involved in Fe transport
MVVRAAVAVFTAVLALFVPSLSTLASAQTVTGTMQGTVRDTSDAVLPGVTVTIASVDTGATRDVVTNDAGFFHAPFLPLGQYRVTATLASFGTIVREGIEITLNRTTVVDFTLNPRVTDTVTVRAAAPVINSTNGEIKSSLTAVQIMDKPTLNPGSFLSLAEIFPGFQENPFSGQNNPTLSSGSSINFNGTGSRAATFQINGVNNDDSSENQNRQGVSLSTIAEFQVISNSFTAEFGRSAGAVVLVQTKSGTNAIHGDLYEYYRNNKLNAKSFFASQLAKPDQTRHQYGGTIGFPLRRDRLFAFLSLDRTTLEGESPYTRDLFLPSELAAPRLTRGNDTPANRAFIDSILARYPSGATPNDARSNRTYQTLFTIDQPDQDYSGRIDWNAGKSDTVFIRQQYTRQIRTSQDVIIGEQARQNNKQQNIGATWTHIFSPRTLGEFRYGLGSRDTNVDIAAGNDTPIIRFTGSPVSGTIIGNAGAYPINRHQTDHQFVYNMTTVLGSNHSIKSGVDVRRQHLDDRADNFTRGFWTFNRICQGTTYDTAYAAFLDGCVQNFQRGYGPAFLENRFSEYNLYAEDSWRIGSSLTLNLGVRYEYVSAPSDTEDRIDYVMGNDRNNVQPRLGFAYAPRWSEGWLAKLTGGPENASIRGGYGMYHGRIFQSVFSQGGANVRFNPPNAGFLNLTTGSAMLNLADPTGGFVFVPGQAAQTARVTLTLIDPELEVPYTHQWNLTVERKMFFDSSLRLTYSGTRGMGFLKYAQDNLPISPLERPVTVADHPLNAPAAGFPDLRGVTIDRVAADVNCAGTGLPGLPVNAECPNVVPIANNEVSFRVPRANERRPDPRYTTNLMITNGADLWYHGLQVEWVKRLSASLQFNAAYTWGKSMDTLSEATAGSGGDTNQTGLDSRFSKGLSLFDTRHRFTFNGSYRLPFFEERRDLVGQVLGGWQASAVVKLVSGTPFTVTMGVARDLNFDGFSEGSRPVLVNPSILHTSIDNPSTSRQGLPVSAFRPPQFGDTELVGRNTFFGDGTNTVDLGLYKSFALPSNHRVLLRLEMYNAFNQVQFNYPARALDTPATFGSITGTSTLYSPRVVQIAVRYLF